MNSLCTRITIGLFATCLFVFQASAAQIEVLWIGHAATKITSVTGKTILIDPGITTIPTSPKQYKDLKNLGKIDLILVTHGHQDHVSDLAELVRITGAKVVGNAELTRQAASLGIIPKTHTFGDKRVDMNKGGTVTPLGPDIKIHMVPADHSSSLDVPNADPERQVYAGAPVGYVVELENGFKIYHSGDTNVFTDMGLIGRMHELDLALVCIGGHFTMDPKGAALALKEFLKPKQVLPIHYGTYPVLKGTPEQLKKELAGSSIKVLDVTPGQVVKF